MSTTTTTTAVEFTAADWRTIHAALIVVAGHQHLAQARGENPWPTAAPLAARVWDEGVLPAYGYRTAPTVPDHAPAGMPEPPTCRECGNVPDTTRVTCLTCLAGPGASRDTQEPHSHTWGPWTPYGGPSGPLRRGCLTCPATEDQTPQ